MRKRLTPSDRQLIYNKYNGHCAYCGQAITRKNFHVDHMLPSCGSCARYKSAYDLETFRRMLSKLPDRLKMLNGILFDSLCVKLKCSGFDYHRQHPMSMARTTSA